MRIAIVGAAGQLGTELQRQLPALSGEIVPLNRQAIDLVSADSVAAALDAARPELVINAAAYNFVDRAEEEPQAAWSVNALGPRNLALWCEAAGAALLHVSTDYVYSGRTFEGTRRIDHSTPYGECDAPLPVNAYGVSKLAGEYFVRALCRRHFVVRTCGLYGRGAATKGNFVETMLRLGRERPELRVVADQHCTPTSAAELARAIIGLAKTDACGLYHATSSGQTTWHGFAVEIFRQAGLDVAVHAVTSEEYGAKARRPAYSVLDCQKLNALLDPPLSTWREALAEYLADRESPSSIA